MKIGQNSDAVAASTYRTQRLKEQDAKNVARNERAYAGELHIAGRNAFFKLIIESKKFEEQNLKSIGPFENITSTYHFIEGVKRGIFMLRNGIIPEEYKEQYQKLLEDNKLNISYQNTIEYLENCGIISDEISQTQKKHR